MVFRSQDIKLRRSWLLVPERTHNSDPRRLAFGENGQNITVVIEAHGLSAVLTLIVFPIIGICKNKTVVL